MIGAGAATQNQKQNNTLKNIIKKLVDGGMSAIAA